MYYKSIQLLSKIYDKTLKSRLNASEDLKQSCDYLNIPGENAERVVKASILLTIIFSIISFTLLFVLYFNNKLSFLYTVFLLLTPVLINHFYSNYYKDKYYSERIKDLGLLPDFFTLIISNLKINPNLEKALMNTVKFDYGRASKEVNKLVKGVNSGKEWDVKMKFIQIMKKFNNSSVDSAVNSLISSLSIRSKEKRNQLLNNSLNYLLKGIVEETKNYSQKIYTPILLLFGFGTIIPLIVISIIPVFGLMKNTSFDITTMIIFFASSIIIIKIIIDDLKKKSPSRFSQVIINKENKGVNPLLLLILFIGLSSPTIIYFFSNIFPYEFEAIQDYKTLFAYIGVSAALSTYYWSKTKRLIKEKEEAEKLENELIDAFYLLSSRINEGHSVESSLKYVSEVINTKMAKTFFKTAHHKISILGLSVQTAFSKAHLLKNVYSQRVKSLVELFVESVQKHSLSASENIIELCDYYNNIRNAENRIINSMSKNIDMIKLTTYFFTPVVCALIINIQRLINSVVSTQAVQFFSLSFKPLNIEVVQFVVSFYVFFLTLVLTELYSFLTSNNDLVSSRYNALKSVSISCIIFTTTLIISRLLLFTL